MANVVSHDLFPTKIHEFEYTPEHYDYTNMVQYIESKNQSAPLYQTEDDIHTISFFKEFREVSVEEGKKRYTKKALIGLSQPYHDCYYSNSKREGLCIYS